MGKTLCTICKNIKHCSLLMAPNGNCALFAPTNDSAHMCDHCDLAPNNCQTHHTKNMLACTSFTIKRKKENNMTKTKPCIVYYKCTLTIWNRAKYPSDGVDTRLVAISQNFNHEQTAGYWFDKSILQLQLIGFNIKDFNFSSEIDTITIDLYEEC